jgi:hypothetical protein
MWCSSFSVTSPDLSDMKRLTQLCTGSNHRVFNTIGALTNLGAFSSSFCPVLLTLCLESCPVGCARIDQATPLFRLWIIQDLQSGTTLTLPVTALSAYFSVFLKICDQSVRVSNDIISHYYTLTSELPTSHAHPDGDNRPQVRLSRVYQMLITFLAALSKQKSCTGSGLLGGFINRSISMGQIFPT